jgi:hypothetical protein
VRRGTTVAILGLAYKPHSQIIEESQAIELAWGLFKAGARVVAYDPLARDGAQTEFRGQILMLDSLADCLAQAEVVLITTPDPAFQDLKAADFAGHESPVTVVDFWRILEKELAGQPNIRYVPVGCSIDDSANAARLNELWNPSFLELKVAEVPPQKSLVTAVDFSGTSENASLLQSRSAAVPAYSATKSDHLNPHFPGLVEGN